MPKIKAPEVPTIPAKFPKSMGACADMLHDIRTARLAADKFAAELKSHEERLKTHIIDNLDKRIESGAAGKHHRVQIVPKRKWRVNAEKWDNFFHWVAKKKRFDLLQKRINDTAVAELMTTSKAKVPGVESFDAVTVSLTKV